MSLVLVSHCNSPVPGQARLALIDCGGGVKESVDLGIAETVTGCTGVVQDAFNVYVLANVPGKKTMLAVLDRATLKPCAAQVLPEVVDGHSLAVSEGNLYAVSTGTDSVYAYEISGRRVHRPRKYWAASAAAADTHHLNSLAVWNGDLLAAGFGPKSGELWSSAKQGYIYNITQNRTVASGIYHPHSLKVHEGRLYYCESATGKFAALGGPSWAINQYVRGLSFIDKHTAIVGASVARRLSKSQGVILNPADPGETAGQCALFRLDIRGGDVQKVIGLEEFGAEVYDVVPA